MQNKKHKICNFLSSAGGSKILEKVKAHAKELVEELYEE
jgi:hypothetical protein